MNGADVFVLVDVEGALVEVGSQRDCEVSETSASVDNSSKDSRRQRVDFGRYAAGITLDSLYVANRADFLRLRNANRQGEKVTLAIREDGQLTRLSQAKIDAMTSTFPDNDASTISVNLTVDDEFVSYWIIGVGALGTVFIS